MPNTLTMYLVHAMSNAYQLTTKKEKRFSLCEKPIIASINQLEKILTRDY